MTETFNATKSNLERLPKETLINIILSNKVLLEQLIDDLNTLELMIVKLQNKKRSVEKHG